MDRYNKLIKIIRSSLKDMSKALKGLIVMSKDLEMASISLYDGKVPLLWMGKSYPSLKTLGPYIIDLKEKI